VVAKVALAQSFDPVLAFPAKQVGAADEAFSQAFPGQIRRFLFDRKQSARSQHCDEPAKEAARQS